MRSSAESEEKRESVSDIALVMDSLKVLDPDGRLEKRTSFGHQKAWHVANAWPENKLFSSRDPCAVGPAESISE
jgi:hypothetical protein